MEKQGSVQTIWLGLLLGVLVITSPNWLINDHRASSYDAPWVYPGDLPKH